ncbi:hypothetical protein D3C71_1676260 [compost metagenome]
MGELWQVVINLQSQLGGQKGEALKQMRGAWIGRLIAQERRQARIVFSELTP